MNPIHNLESNPLESDLVITRDLNAPIDLVWKAWTDGASLAQWWGPKGFELKVVQCEVQPGGIFHYSMQSPDGMIIWGRFVYQEIERPSRLAWINCFSDENGGLGRNPWMPDWPLEVANVMRFVEQNGKTTLTLRARPINATEEQMKMFAEFRANMNQGFAGTFEKLDKYLEAAKESATRGSLEVVILNDTEVKVIRSFKAPRALVFEAWTNPKHIPNWMLGLKGWMMTICEADLRPGGAFRLGWRNLDGVEMEIKGKYIEIIPPERIVSTESWGPEWPETTNAIVLQEANGVTTLTLTITYISKEVRDSALETGAMEGMSMTCDWFEDYLGKLGQSI